MTSVAAEDMFEMGNGYLQPAQFPAEDHELRVSKSSSSTEEEPLPLITGDRRLHILSSRFSLPSANLRSWRAN